MLLAVAAAALALPGSASAAQLWFGDLMDPPPASFGANASITIGGRISFINTCAEGTDDRFAAFADVFIVPTGSASAGAKLTDVGGAANTVGPGASGGLFDDTTIGFTKPSGKIPSGTFDIVYDECQDGKLSPEDTVFSPGIIVNVPKAAVPDVTGAIQAVKTAAAREALPWLVLLKSVEAVEELQKNKAMIECIQSGIAGCVLSTLVNMAQDYLKEQFMKAFGTTDPNDAAKIYVANHIKKYAAIAADPPDPDFLTPSAVILPPQLVSPSADPLLRAHVAVGNAAGVEAALAEAFLHAIERYQGADADDNGDAALMQARAIRSHARLVAAQADRTSAVLDDLVAAYAADARDFDVATAQLEQLRARVEADGFTAEELRTLRNLGLSATDLEALHAKISNDSYAGFSEAGLAASVAEIQSANDALANAMLQTAVNMNSIVSVLAADPVTSADAPIVIAGGPYTASAGSAVVLDGSGSAVYPGRTVTSYEWDLDGDGAFDDAAGATPSATFATGGDRIVGLRVTDSAGLSGISYAAAAVTATNGAPTITASSPTSAVVDLDVGSSETFSVSATDPDGDALTTTWSVNGAAAGIGATFAYTPAASDVGIRVVRALVSDASADGVAEREWGVRVLAADGDNDGWNANVDCNDGNPDVHPTHREVVGNTVDDDCDSTTLDTGSPPVAGFTHVLAPALLVTFTDASRDPNEDVTEWLWSFGDGGTSTVQNPSHTYATKGSYLVALTVTDSSRQTATVTKTVGVSGLPTASFTYQPPSPAVGGEIDFTDTSSDSDGAIAGWAWDFGDGGTSTAQNPIHIYLGPGTFAVKLTVTDDDGSTGTSSQNVTIGVGAPGTAPIALFRADVPGRDVAASANGGTVVGFSNQYDSNHTVLAMLDDVVGLPWAVCVPGPHFATIQISTGAPRLIDSIALMPRADYFEQRVKDFAVDVASTGTAAADFTQVLATTAADNSTLQSFALPPGTLAKYVRYRPINARNSTCISTSKFKVLTASSGPRRVTFQNQSTNAVSSKWTFGDGSTSTAASPTHTYATVGSYTVTLAVKAADGRTNTVSRVYEARGPTANFSIDPVIPEPGQPAVFTDSSVSPSASVTTFAWDFGDGGTSTSAGTLHTFAAGGTYAVKYTVTDAEGNADTVTKNVLVAEPAAAALPRARFSPSTGGVNVAFSGAGATIHSFSSQYSTSYPPSTILDEEPSNNYWATANTVRNGWVKIDLAGDLQDVDRIRIGGDGGDQRVKDFRVSVSSTTADDAAFTQVLAATNTNDDNLREYVFPAGTVSARYIRVELLNNWGSGCCVAIDRFDVLTGPTASAGRNLALAEDGATIAAFSGQYDPTTYPVTRLIDGDPSTPPWLTTNGVMTGYVKVTLSSAAPRMVDRIKLQPRQGGQKVKDFEVAVSATGTADADFVTVLSATAADKENLQTFLLPHPMPAKHVLYRILTNRAGGNYTGTGDLQVETGQEARSRTVRFRNLSRGATSYAWDFGDGGTSTGATPTHTYAAAGTYTVTLTATNANGSATFALEQVVRTAAIGFTPAAPEAQQQIDFLDESPIELGLKSWSWDFGDGSADSDFRHPVKTYAAAGTYTVTLTGTDRDGVEHVATKAVTVGAPSFRAQFHPRGNFNMASLENGAAVVAYSSRYFDSAWWPDKLLDAYPDTAWHTNTSPAENTKWIKFSLARGETYQIDRFQLLGRSACCSDQHPRDFEIAVSTTGTADADFKTVLRATLPPSQSALQTFVLPRPVLAKYVYFRVLNNRGSNVVATAMLRAPSGQVNTPTVTFDDLTVGGVAPLTYAWAFGDGGTSTQASPTHTFSAPGVYDVTVTVTDATGATSSSTLRQRILNAPNASFSNAPLVPNEVGSATFTDTTPSPADGPIAERRWSWGDGTQQTVTTTAGTTHVFADNGSYDVKLEVLDGWGQTASVTRTIVVANVAPTIEAGPGWRWREDRALTATPTTADVAGSRDPITCTWTYGDGSAPGTGCAFSHTYADPGTFTPTVTAADGDGGTASDSFIVEVIEQEVTGGGGGGSGAAGGTGVGKVAKDYAFTLDDDFELGTLLNVNHDAPGTNQLQLNKQAKPFPFVYIANSGRGTAVRIDVDSGAIVGEYMTAPVNRSRNPSRTTVDKLGNVWVTNRDESSALVMDGVNRAAGSTTRIGLIVGGTRSNANGTPNTAGEYLKAPFEYNTCVDKDADGLIRTSRGLTNILAWPNASGVDHDGGIETAVDECIQFYVRVLGTRTRTVAITADNDAYIGGDNNWHERVDGETGQRVPGTAFNLSCGGYGGLIDGNGILWSARYGNGLLRYDTNTKTGVCLGNSNGDYGLGVDPVTGHIWQTTLSGTSVVKLDPTKKTTVGLEIGRYPHGHPYAQGVAVDSKGSVWVSHSILSGAPTIGRVRTDGVYLGNANLGGGTGSTGVAVDANGKVWSANLNTSNASRIDPEIGQRIGGTVPSGWFDKVVDLGAGAAPYNYSDMTGAVAIGAASPSGFWSIQQDGTALGTVWKRISWDGSTPGGTTITVEARAADTQAALTSTPFITAQDGGPLAGVVGRFIEVRATLQTNDPTTTPILTDIRISANTPPVASDATAETPKNTSKAITLPATDAEGDTLTYELVDGPANGSVTIVGSVATYTPTPGYVGPDSFRYRARDSDGTSNVATVSITVLQTNRTPVADDASVSTPEDTPLTVTLPVSDPDGDTLTIVTTPPANGTFAGGVYTPAPNFNGSDSFSYTATDSGGESDTGTISITVTPANDPPTADDRTVATDEDTPLALTLTGGDIDGDVLSFTVATSPLHGSFDGAVYTPALNYHGPDSFTFIAHDGNGGVDLGTVTITVRPVNDVPAAADRDVTTDEDTPLPIVLAGTDVDGDTLTVTTTDPAHGTYAGGIYTPAANYSGPDAFTYTVNDGNGGTDSGLVTITVRPVNDAPIADDQTVATDEDVPLTIALAGTDVDGDTLTITSSDPAHGSYAGGIYTPAANYHGPDSFTYTASDGSGGSDTATVTIAVRPVNDAPVADDQAVATDEDTPLAITFGSTDVDGGAPVFALATAPQHGTWNGSTYTPDSNYHGTDSFDFLVTDGAGGTDVGTISITVRPVNDAPVAADQTVSTDEDTPLPIALAGADIDGDTLTITTTDPTHGSYAGGTYTPAANYHGPDTFTYTVNDGNGGTDTGLVTITVRPVNDAPTANDQTVATDEDAPLPITLTGADIDGDTLTFVVVSGPAHGSYAGGVYTPAPNYFGPDAFTFEARDGNGGVATGTVTITVRPVNEPPTVTLAGAAAVDEGGPPISLAATGVDPDGDALTYAWSSDSGALVAAGGTATFAHDDGPRVATVTVTVSDGSASAAASLPVTVRNVAPMVVAGPPASGFWGLALVLAGSASDPSAADTAAGLAAQWAFGDGTLPVVGLVAGHVYSTPGPYVATLTVVDKDGGIGSATRQVTIAKRTTSIVYTGATTAPFGLRTLTAQLGDTVNAATADLAGKTLTFRLGTRTFTAITDAGGVATATSALPLSTGDVELSFAGDARYLPSNTTARLTIASGPGKITGGGLRSLNHNGRGGFNVHSSDKGELQWQNGVLNFHAPEITGLGVAPDGRSAWFAGIGRDGRAYVAYVEDNGEPGRSDIFKLWIGGVLQTPGDGRLSGGNIQIHKS